MVNYALVAIRVLLGLYAPPVPRVKRLVAELQNVVVEAD